MLQVRKSLIGIALSAIVFVGCQSAQKTAEMDASDEALNFPGYGSDRNPASAGTIIEMVLKEMRLVGSKAGAKAGEKAASGKFVAYVNAAIRTSKDADVIALRKEVIAERKAALGKKFKSGVDDVLTEEDMKRLPDRVQGELAAKFLKSEAAKDLPSLNALRTKVDSEIASMAGSDVKGLKGKAKLLSNETGDASKFNSKVGKVSAKESESYQILIKSLDKLVDNEATEAGKAEVRVLVKKARIAAGKVYQLSGLSHLMPETCQNLDLPALREYVKLLNEVEAELKTFPIDKATGRVKCANVAEITVYVAAKFQERLGRLGLTALVAVEEMSVCNYLSPETAPASRKIASESGGKIPDRPACK